MRQVRRSPGSSQVPGDTLSATARSCPCPSGRTRARAGAVQSAPRVGPPPPCRGARGVAHISDSLICSATPGRVCDNWYLLRARPTVRLTLSGGEGGHDLKASVRFGRFWLRGRLIAAVAVLLALTGVVLGVPSLTSAAAAPAADPVCPCSIWPSTATPANPSGERPERGGAGGEVPLRRERVRDGGSVLQGRRRTAARTPATCGPARGRSWPPPRSPARAPRAGSRSASRPRWR